MEWGLFCNSRAVHHQIPEVLANLHQEKKMFIDLSAAPTSVNLTS